MNVSPLLFKNFKDDLPASVVVFFVALPLCLGVALASGAPLFSGLIAGIIGGAVVGSISGASLGVSGPAAGLTVLVLTAISGLGGFENFLLTVILAGVMQVILGVVKAGVIGYFFPSSVIKGMLTAIGIIIILKQIPHMLGYDATPEGADAFLQSDGENTFSELSHMMHYISPGAMVVSLISLGIILFWDLYLAQKSKIFKLIQGAFVAVVVGIFYHNLTQGTAWGIAPEHLVSVPIPENVGSFLGQFTLPNWGAITIPEVWITAVTIAIVASLETLLSVEAIDKLDPEKRTTPTNQELVAQGVGNILSGCIGGLPITQVIVRSSANLQSGAKTKMATILHGVLLLLAVILVPKILNQIPLAVLATILIVVGYKLAKISIFTSMYKLGRKQFVPFMVTVLAIVLTDLLKGIGIGLAVAIVVILLKSYQNSHFLHKVSSDPSLHHVKMTLAEEVTFLNKGAILKELDGLPEACHLELDITRTQYLDYDILEILEDFAIKAQHKNIDINVVSEYGVFQNPKSYIKLFHLRPNTTVPQV